MQSVCPRHTQLTTLRAAVWLDREKRKNLFSFKKGGVATTSGRVVGI
jgi:hypothetical protein